MELIPAIPTEATQRFWLIDADGEPELSASGQLGHQTLPAPIAVKEMAIRHGFGLWDNHDRCWVVPIAFDRRIRWAQDQIAALKEQLGGAEAQLAEFREMQKAEQGE